LDNEGVQPLGMRKDHAHPDRRAVVMDVQRAGADLQRNKEIVHRLGQMIEGIMVGRWRRRLALPEAREIRCNKVIMGSQQWNQRVELPGGGRKAVQQHDRRRVLRPGLAIEDPYAVDLRAMIGGRGCDRRDRFCGRYRRTGERHSASEDRPEVASFHGLAPL